MSAPVVRLRVRKGSLHPWIFQAMVKDFDRDARAGTWVSVVDREGVPVGQGFFNIKSKIALRMLSFGEAQAEPEAVVDRLLKQAVALRRDLLKLDAVSDAWRLANSEGDGLSGLIADRYGDAIVLELFSVWPSKMFPAIEKSLKELFPEAKVFVRADKRIQELEGFTAPADRSPSGTADIREHGLKFRVDLSGHKTGAFLDHGTTARPSGKSPRTPGSWTAAATPGFALAAAAAGAAEVTGVDR